MIIIACEVCTTATFVFLWALVASLCGLDSLADGGNLLACGIGLAGIALLIVGVLAAIVRGLWRLGRRLAL